MLRLIILILIISACGVDCISHKPTVKYHKEVVEYIKLFEQDHLEYTGRPLIITDLIITFNDIKTEENPDGLIIIGQCKTKYNTTPRIELDKKYWSYSDHYNKKRLVYHELGHCVLNLRHPHNNDELGIMSAVNMPYWECRNNEQYYIEQFFTEGK